MAKATSDRFTQARKAQEKKRKSERLRALHEGNPTRRLPFVEPNARMKAGYFNTVVCNASTSFAAMILSAAAFGCSGLLSYHPVVSMK